MERDSALRALQLQLSQAKDRLARLTDAYLDQVIERDLFEQRKAALFGEQKDVEAKILELETKGEELPQHLVEFLELAGSAWLLYKSSEPEEKRDLLTIVTSNREVYARSVDLVLSEPFQLVANRREDTNGAPYRDRPRTLDRLFKRLIAWFKANPGTLNLALGAHDSREDESDKRGRVAA